MTSRTLAQTLGLVLTGMFTVVGAAHAADTPSTQKAPPVRAIQAGQQVAIDPVTGQLRAPTAAERAAYAKAFQARQSQVSLSSQPRTNAEAAKTVRKITLRNGAQVTGMRLPQERMSSVVATRAADGTLSIHHEDNGAPTAPKAPEATR